MSITLIIGVSAFGAGILSVFDYDLSFNNYVTSNLSSPASSQLSLNTDPAGGIDYSRPDVPDVYTLNTGGPLSIASSNDKDAELEKQIRSILATTNHAFIPSMWAHMGKINNEFGFRRSPFGGRTYEFHAGIDIDGERGDEVVAPANGVVTEAGWNGGYGNMIEVDHGNGFKTRYGHLSKIDVEIGQQLTRGQIMAFVGSTGRSTGPHLHFELRLHDRPINPRRFLPLEPTELKKIS